ncbi:MAG TPA: hypothetical protein DCM14_05540 [Clostridiales bacterium UBA8153]|nr:hypothetical protein [Clostridiales bacterium UBA8153]
MTYGLVIVGGMLTVEEAVRRMPSGPATRLDLTGRRVVVAGTRADLVVFEPVTVRDLTDFSQLSHSPRARPQASYG